MSTCFFIGHRDAPESLRPSLFAEVERHITQHGVTEFIVGNYGRFDSMAAWAVKEAKKRYTIELRLLLPYHPALRPVAVPEGFDGTFYPPGMEAVPKRAAIIRANRYMADHCGYLIAYACHPASNARNLVEYARRRGGVCITVLDSAE